MCSLGTPTENTLLFGKLLIIRHKTNTPPCFCPSFCPSFTIFDVKLQKTFIPQKLPLNFISSHYKHFQLHYIRPIDAIYRY